VLSEFPPGKPEEVQASKMLLNESAENAIWLLQAGNFEMERFTSAAASSAATMVARAGYRRAPFL